MEFNYLIIEFIVTFMQFSNQFYNSLTRHRVFRYIIQFIINFWKNSFYYSWNSLISYMKVVQSFYYVIHQKIIRK